MRPTHVADELQPVSDVHFESVTFLEVELLLGHAVNGRIQLHHVQVNLESTNIWS